MTGVEELLHLINAVALFAVGNVFAGENQIINDRAGVGPAAEQIVVFEKRVVTVAGMGHHQRLHGYRVLLHQVGDAGIGVNHNLIGQPLLTVLIRLLGFDKLFTERPVRVVDGHADAGIGIHHLLGSNDFDLVRIGVETV